MLGFLAVAFALAGLATGGASYALHRRVNRSGELLLRSEAQISELRRLRQARLDVVRATGFADGVVAGGTRVVQGMHYGIAAIPFGILEAIPPTRSVTRIVHVAHDLIAGGVYGAISLGGRTLNRALAKSGP